MEIPKGLIMMLPALGIKIPPDAIKEIEETLPQIPGMVQAILRNFEEINARLARIEERLNAK